ncbi:MAG: YidC/Oxa1 family membrane protein insertase [Acholeplasmataceae bacterium]|jgi:YidC/Oxa1 family membrane protein insertase|nr:YidC/Oxa1 family membrane protein insertase [Acholeplasmataceae bacterium]
MNRKLIFIVMMLFLVIGLAACGGADTSTKTIVVNDPTLEKLVYNEGDPINIRGLDGVSYWDINKDGSISEKDYDILPTHDVPVTGVRTYTLIAEELERSFQIYVTPDGIGEDDEIVMLGFRFVEHNVRLRIGQDFNPEGMIIYAVQRDGDVVELKGEDYVANFDDGGYEPLNDGKFQNKVLFEVSFEYGGVTKSFEVYVAGGEKPISTKDASFFDWILVIPVAFVMHFFAGLMGNSFALGILFTTIVVRTLAWPIYAKSNDLSIKMNLAQPEMQRVQAKYATRKDPQSQQMMQMELLQVYKRHGINILGCLFPFLQMPIFIAMYGVVRRITLEGGMYADSVKNVNFLFGIVDLSKGSEVVVSTILAAIVGGTMYILQKISMKKPSYAKNTGKHTPNPQAAQTEKTMKFVSYFMIVIMAVASFSSNALALYWIFGNMYSLGQTLVNRRLNEKKHERLKQKQLMG